MISQELISISKGGIPYKCRITEDEKERFLLKVALFYTYERPDDMVDFTIDGVNLFPRLTQSNQNDFFYVFMRTEDSGSLYLRQMEVWDVPEKVSWGDMLNHSKPIDKWKLSWDYWSTGISEVQIASGFKAVNEKLEL